MMDSQDNILEQEVKEEAIQDANVPEVETPEVAPAAEEQKRGRRKCWRRFATRPSCTDAYSGHQALTTFMG